MFNSNNSKDPTHYYASLLERCVQSKNLNFATALHSLIIKTALNFNAYFSNHLIHIYSKCNLLHKARLAFDDLPSKNSHSYNTLIGAYAQVGSFDCAQKLFNEMPHRNIVSYNSIISGYARCGLYKEAIGLFRLIQRQLGWLQIDKFTVVSVVSACTGLASAGLLRQVHGVVVTIGIELNLIMYNVLVDAYGKCGGFETARRLFDQMPVRDVVSWTSTVAAYTQVGMLKEACSVFEDMPTRNTISWTALITGFVQTGDGHGALTLFKRMREEGFPPGDSTFVVVLSACADLALVEHGKQLHGCIIKNQIMGPENFNIYLYNALVDMYSKCGDMKYASILFGRMPKKDIVSWNSLVTGLALNGCGNESLIIFERMIEAGVKPNHVTFSGVLSACSHAGLVLKGREYLHRMEEDYGVTPRLEHYAIIVDALGRKNQLGEAMELIKSIDDINDSVGMWGALLGACRIHGNLDLARVAAEKLFNLEPKNAARYVMLSNIYAAANRWSDARLARAIMRERGLKKETACSWIAVRNARHGFVAKDNSHEQTEEIYEMLFQLADQIRDVGYLANNRRFSFPDSGDGTI